MANFGEHCAGGLDMIIAAVAEANGCVVVTANENDFRGIPFINPQLAAK